MDLKLNQNTFNALEKIKGGKSVSSLEYDLDGRKATVLDIGVSDRIKGKSAEKLGLIIADASMGLLGKTRIDEGMLTVEISRDPVIATLGCQLAGWAIEIDGKKRLGSGPARILARKPGKIIDAAGYTESSDKAALILETKNLPGKEECRKILDETKANELIIAAFREDSTIGLINVLARIVEVGMFRLHNIGYDTRKVIWAKGTVPIPPQGKDIMYTSNDAIIYRGTVSMETEGWDANLTERTVSKISTAYGKNFKEIFTEAGSDFYKIDPQIFAPAQITIKDLLDGKTYSAGGVYVF
ncbi:MAG: methenyltetrahydromethanopterin cyclohydrolase [Candidatus Altiarchaeia archaeon]